MEESPVVVFNSSGQQRPSLRIRVAAQSRPGPRRGVPYTCPKEAGRKKSGEERGEPDRRGGAMLPKRGRARKGDRWIDAAIDHFAAIGYTARKSAPPSLRSSRSGSYCVVQLARPGG